jgi:hypothetical protein
LLINWLFPGLSSLGVAGYGVWWCLSCYFSSILRRVSISKSDMSRILLSKDDSALWSISPLVLFSWMAFFLFENIWHICSSLYFLFFSIFFSVFYLLF